MEKIQNLSTGVEHYRLSRNNRGLGADGFEKKKLKRNFNLVNVKIYEFYQKK